MEDYESILLVKPEVFVYKIPPRTTTRGYRAADWNLGSPEWTGRMKLISIKNQCIMKLEDKITGELFAKCPIEKYPSIAVEAVTDSSRYFVIRVQSDDEKSAFLGLGFGDRSDSFDMNVALQDHFKWITKEEEAKNQPEEAKPALDLGFKKGETIKINMKIAKRDGQESSTTKQKQRTSASGMLPPPPAGIKPPPAVKSQCISEVDLLQGTDPSAAVNAESSWGDFESAAPKQNTTEEAPVKNTGWVQF